jgi:hypothetical protein
MEALSCGLGVIGLGLDVRLNCNDWSNGRDIGHRRRWGYQNFLYIGTGMFWPLTGAPVIIPVTLMPGAIPPMGIAMGVVIIGLRLKRWIWFGLGAQGA